MKNESSNSKIIYFDGLCNVCNRFVDFLIRHDRRHVLKYAPLQGSTAAARLPPQLVADMSTVVFADGDQIFVESAAALRAIAEVGGIYSAARVFLFIPGFLRDAVYRWVANHRYLFAGRRSTCRLPTPEERAMFLD